MMKIAVGKSRTDTKWRTVDMTWEEMVGKLRTPFKSHETMREYRAMTKEEQGRVKDVGGFVGGEVVGGRRVKGSVPERWLITLDADQSYDGQWDDAMLMLAGTTVCMYSTHSYRVEAPRVRFVIPLNRAAVGDEYQAIARKVAEWVGIETMDPCTYEAERLMYWPSVCSDGDYLFAVSAGDPLDVDAVLAEYGLGTAWKDSTLWPIAKSEDEITLHEKKRQGDPLEKPGMVGLFCRTYSISEAIDQFLSDVYEPCAVDGRYTYMAGTTSAGVVVYEDKYAYSHHGTDPCGGQLVNAFDMVRIHLFRDLDAKYTGDINRAPSYLKMCELAAQDEQVKKQMSAELEAEVADIFSGPDQYETDGGAGEGAGETGGEDDGAWESQLDVNKKTGAPECTIANAVLILQNDPALRGALAINELKARPVVRRRVPWRRSGVADERNGDSWTDADNAGLRLYMEARWKFVGKDKIQDAFDIVCEAGRFHPIREYLAGLTWDGKERLDTMLIRYMGARDNPFIRAATRKWMCAAVKRALVPGCKFDQMLVLVGRQGVGKSNLAKTLSRGWFTDSLGRMDSSKDAYERLSGVWIAEIAELAAAKKAEVEDIKNFITKQEDTFRRAYGREVGVYPRQCVFYGTTNDMEFLRDRTGARRFWPVEVRGIGMGELVGLEEEVDQLWAEAQERLRGGEVLYMNTEELARMAREAQEEHTMVDDLVYSLQDYLDRARPANWYSLSPEDRRGFVSGIHEWPDETLDDVIYVQRITPLEIRQELCMEDRSKNGGNDMTSRRIAGLMNTMQGWHRAESKIDVPGYPRRQRGWERDV